MWEQQVTEGWTKPEPNAARGERERWIRSKYEQRAFVVGACVGDRGGTTVTADAHSDALGRAMMEVCHTLAGKRCCPRVLVCLCVVCVSVRCCPSLRLDVRVSCVHPCVAVHLYASMSACHVCIHLC